MRQKLKRGLCAVLILTWIFTISAYARPNWPADVGIQAEAGIVTDLDSDTVLLGQNSHVSYPPASITKILTALIVLEHADLSETVTYSETAMNSVERDSGNKLSLVAGDTMTVEDCLYAMLLVSVNQAANALAEHVAGSIPAFVDMMNAKLDELGLTESHFENPSGLNGDSQYVSAYDMAKIAKAAYSNEKLLEISSTVTRELGPTQNNPEGVSIRNEHRLVVTEDQSSSYYYPEAVAGKTGYLIAAGNTLVTYAEKDGRRLVSVILKGKPRQYFLDGKALLQFGFSRFYNADIAENETRFVTGNDPVTVNGISWSPSDLMIEPLRAVTLPVGTTIADADVSLAELPESSPLGAVALLQYTYNDRAIGSAFLVERERYTGAFAATIAEAETDPAATEETAAAETEANEGNETEKEQKEPGFFGGIVGRIVIVVLVILAAATIFIVAYLVYMRRKAEQEAARRRARRRQRLMEEGGGMEAEFERLLAEKKDRERDRKRR